MWQIDCAKNTLKATLPFQRQLRQLKRRISRNSHQINEQSVYSGGFDQIEFLCDAGAKIEGASILEVGTGWYPVIPLMFRIAGAGHVVLTDAHRLIDLETIRTAIAFLMNRKANIAERFGMSMEAVEARLTLSEDIDFDGALEALNMTYAVPFNYDIVETKVDVIYSHTVLEHIPPHVISALLKDWRRALKPGGLVSHGVDHSDHRANLDPKLSRIDFLRYSDRVWQLCCINPQDYTNRLRHPDYVDLFKMGGYDLIQERAMVNETCVDDLVRLPVDRRFEGVPKEDLATLWSNLIARPAAV